MYDDIHTVFFTLTLLEAILLLCNMGFCTDQGRMYLSYKIFIITSNWKVLLPFPMIGGVECNVHSIGENKYPHHHRRIKGLITYVVLHLDFLRLCK
jgi:hypothetical protein